MSDARGRAAQERQRTEKICRRRALDAATEDFRRRGVTTRTNVAVLTDAEVYRAFLLGGNQDHDERTRTLDYARRFDCTDAAACVALAKRFLAYVEKGSRR